MNTTVFSVLWWVLPGLSLAAAFAQDTAPVAWGPLWQPQLPAHERHPSLFFDAADRPRMLARLRQPPTDSWWQEFRRVGYRCRPALEWWLLGDEAAARRAREDLLRTPIWREPTHGYLEPSSFRFADYILAYDFLAAWPGLTAEDRSVMRGQIAAEADHYYKVLDTVSGGCNYGNQRTLAASALGMAALVLCESTDGPLGPSAWLARALYQIRRDENWWFIRPDGLFIEGLGYTGYMGLLFVPFAIAYERATGQYLFADERLRQWLTFAACQTTAQRELIPWGTCESGHGVRFFVLLSNPRYGRDLAPLCHWAFDWHTVGPHSLQVPLALAAWEPEVPGDLPPASRAFPKSQTVVLREHWGHDTVTVWFAGKDGAWPLARRYSTYSHADAGHFVIAGWDEILAGDSGYDHWKTRDYYGAEFHNVLLIDGKGPQQDTAGEMSDMVIEGSVRHATVTSVYQGCSVRRTLALVRGRYVVVADRVVAEDEHDYTWQVRSTCPPDSPGSMIDGRTGTWPGLDAMAWRELKPGKTQLTTVVPEFARLSVAPGRWRPISAQPEFHNQVATARWRAASTAALFVLIPNLKAQPDVTWQAGENGAVQVAGPGWRDRVVISGGELLIRSADGMIEERLHL